MMSGVTIGVWLLAAAPIALLLGLVLWARFSITVNGLVVIGFAIVIAMTHFQAGPAVVGVGLAKGIWTGIWVLAVIWPALLLFQLVSKMGLLQMGPMLRTLLARPVENILVLAWILPSFIQGVAGFGVPVAVGAPLLLQVGVSPIKAVAMPLVGSHWSVGFGSMGSSFYMGALTAGLDPATTHEYAATGSVLSGINLVISGLLVCLLHGGLGSLKQGAGFVLTVGPVMALAQVLTVRAEPSIGALSAGAIGLATVTCIALVRRRRRRRVPLLKRPPLGETVVVTTRQAWLLVLPYLLLTVAVLAVFLPPQSRTWVKTHLLLGFSFPMTQTGLGQINRAVEKYTVIPLLGHPGTYLLLSTALSMVVWFVLRAWPRATLGHALRTWARQALRSSIAVLLLASVATVMVDSGMVTAVAHGASAVTDGYYPLLASTIGVLGAFTTGSSTSSQALFSPLQYQVATKIGFSPSSMLALQLAGSNVGNVISPMAAVVGTSAIGRRDLSSQVVRMTLIPALCLNLVLVAAADVLTNLG
jgi:lactate permease